MREHFEAAREERIGLDSRIARVGTTRVSRRVSEIDIGSYYKGK